MIAVGDPWGKVGLWDTDKKERLKSYSLGRKKSIERVEFSKYGKWLACYLDGVLHLIDVSDVKQLTDPTDEKK